ncbi:MAG: hypothetical protein II180_08830, partial [Proteobacteria bacterium]|nr:hypothetical protein [Pseudomonadota bacterium]
KEACPAGKACDEDGECMFIVDPAIALDEPEDKATDESGKTVSLTLHLNNAPSAEVRVACEVITESQNKEVDAACDEIVFNADNWQLEQTIILTGVDDYIKDGDQVYKLKVTTASEDIDFNELVAESVELTNVDMTKAGLIFSETALTTYEDQEQPAATFTAKLSSIPSSDVSLTMSSSNAKEGSVSPMTLKFTKDNWSEPQTVTVQGLDDDIRDGNANYTIFFAPAESNDEDYSGLQPSPIKVTNIDNDHAGLNINIPAEDFEILEGQVRPVLVKLNTQPKKDVKVVVAVDDKTEAAFDVEEVTLNSENWNTGKEIILNGVADHIIDGDQPIKLTFTATSDDEDYNLEPLQFDGKVKDVDTAEVMVSMGDSPNVKEGDAGFVTMSVSLSSQPTKNVSVALSVTDDTELKINKTTLTFTSEHWDVPQDILVSSVDDDIVDGNIKSKVVMKVTSSDSNFNSKDKEVEFTTLDDDVAGFLITSNAASFPENSGSTTSMKVSLQSQPTADVKVTVSSTDASELSVTSATTLTFTKANWNKPQDVTIKVVDDNIADGTQMAQVKFVGASTDSNFNGITGLSAVYTITDDDAPSVALSTKESTISQASPSTVASVVLGIQPSANVTVTMVSDSKAITFSKTPLTFTTDNWNVPQNVTINADFAGIATASATATITAKATGTSYNVTSNAVQLNLVKIPEVQNFTYTGKVQSTMLPAGSYKLEVWGAQGGGSYGNGTWKAGTGKGGYAVGTLTLNSASTVYIYVGGKGEDANLNGTNVAGGFNGGGGAVGDNDSDKDDGGGGGGGASDVRIGTDSLYSRVIVAGGGGGNGFHTAYRNISAGHGGGVSGTAATESPSEPGTATSGHEFGVGGTGETAHGGVEGGGGGGWYGGTHGIPGDGSVCGAGGAGGSGYVYKSDTAANYPAGGKLNNSHYLSNAQTIAGNASFPAPGGGNETGHPNNGHVRITLVK